MPSRIPPGGPSRSPPRPRPMPAALPVAPRRPAGSPSRSGPSGGRLRPKRRGWKIAGLTVLASLGLGLAFIVIGQPFDFVSARIAAVVKARTGRDLVVKGGTKFRLTPSPGLVMGDVTISAPAGMPGAPTLRIAALEVGLRVLPLLRREVDITRLVVREPVLDLSVDKAGQRSWAIERHRPDSSGPTAAAPPEPAAAPGAQRPAAAVADIAFENVVVENGTIRFHDERSGRAVEFGAVNANLRLASLETPLDATGSFTLNGVATQFTGRLASPRRLLEAAPADIALSLTSPMLEAHYEGAILSREALDLSGKLDARGPSARGLARLAGYEPGEALGPMGAFALNGGLRWQNGAATLRDATGSLDGATASGTLALDARGPRPRLTGAVKVSQLILGGAPAGPAPQPGPPAAANVPPQPQVKGFLARGGWSESPLPFASLTALDADVQLDVAGSRIQSITLGPARVAIGLDAGRLRVGIEDVALYGGHGKGTIILDASGPTARLDADLVTDAVAIEPLLKDAAGFDWLAGQGHVALKVSGTGMSERGLVETLSGTGDIVSRSGAVLGYNVPRRLGMLGRGEVPNLKRANGERTEITELGATFQIANGIAQTSDLKIAGPEFALTGAGWLALPQRTMDLGLHPRLIAGAGSAIPAAGTAAALAGLEVPVRITGPWEAPALQVDVGDALKGLAKDPGKAVDAVKDALNKVDGKKAGAAVAKAKELLGKFLNQR